MKVSVFVPTHRLNKLFDLCIRSILIQDLAGWELEIIILDSSENRQAKKFLIDNFLTDNRIKIYELAKEYAVNMKHKTANLYLGMIRGLGTEKCTGDLIIEVDSDDMLMPNAIKTIINAHRELDYDFYFTDHYSIKYIRAAIKISNNANITTMLWNFESMTDFEYGFLRKEKLVNVLFAKNGVPGLLGIPGLNVHGEEIKVHGTTYLTYLKCKFGREMIFPKIWKREFLIEQLGGYNKSLRFCEDHDIIFRTILATRKICRIVKPCYIRVENGKMKTKRKYRKSRRLYFLKELWPKYALELKKCCVRTRSLKTYIPENVCEK